MTEATFVPAAFDAPQDIRKPYFILTKLVPELVDLDYDAVMSSTENLRHVFGRETRWPSDSMTLSENHADLVRHADDFSKRQGFTYSVLNSDADHCLGCVYIYPFAGEAYDAEVYYWVRDSALSLEAALGDFLQAWMAEWPFERPVFPGRDVSWDDWEALSEGAVGEDV